MRNNRNGKRGRKLHTPEYLKEKLQENYRDERLLSTREVAECLSVTTSTLCRWRFMGQGPNFVKINTGYYYYQDDLVNWIKSRKVNPAEACNKGA